MSALLDRSFLGAPDDTRRDGLAAVLTRMPRWIQMDPVKPLAARLNLNSRQVQLWLRSVQQPGSRPVIPGLALELLRIETAIMKMADLPEMAEMVEGLYRAYPLWGDSEELTTAHRSREDRYLMFLAYVERYQSAYDLKRNEVAPHLMKRLVISAPTFWQYLSRNANQKAISFEALDILQYEEGLRDALTPAAARKMGLIVPPYLPLAHTD